MKAISETWLRRFIEFAQKDTPVAFTEVFNDPVLVQLITLSKTSIVNRVQFVEVSAPIDPASA